MIRPISTNVRLLYGKVIRVLSVPTALKCFRYSDDHVAAFICNICRSVAAFDKVIPVPEVSAPSHFVQIALRWPSVRYLSDSEDIFRLALEKLRSSHFLCRQA